MTPGERQLRLVVPLPAEFKTLFAENIGKQRFFSLETWLSRADHTCLSHSSVDELLCDLFSVDTSKGLPYAALSWYADTGRPPPENLLRADPVHLYPDMEYVLLFDNSHFSLSSDEVLALLQPINELLAEEGWNIDAPCAERWYMQGPVSESTDYSPIHMVSGENILPHFPSGELAAKWRQVLNEIQMIMHSHPVNEQREQRGERVVNAVWPWGGGHIQRIAEVDITSCFGDSTILKGLSVSGGVPLVSSPEEVIATANGIIVLPALHDMTQQGVSEYMTILDQKYAGPLLAKLRAGEIENCEIYFGSTDCYRVTRGMLSRWWRRKKSLAVLLSA